MSSGRIGPFDSVEDSPFLRIQVSTPAPNAEPRGRSLLPHAALGDASLDIVPLL